MWADDYIDVAYSSYEENKVQKRIATYYDNQWRSVVTIVVQRVFSFTHKGTANCYTDSANAIILNFTEKTGNTSLNNGTVPGKYIWREYEVYEDYSYKIEMRCETATGLDYNTWRFDSTDDRVIYKRKAITSTASEIKNYPQAMDRLTRKAGTTSKIISVGNFNVMCTGESA
mgnify:CR=1 FL=1